MSAADPILPGFYPDPSICRVGEDFYLVNSSFEYFPGVPLWHSRDLRHWRQLGHVLTRPSQLPIPDGTKPSDGIYAPTLRYHDGRFYMITTNMPALGNFLVHATDPAGPWSEPVLLAQGGIDPSLYFDADGRCYFTSNGTNWAPVRGAYQCEINPLTGEQLSPTRFIWPGTGGAYPEAPHLFKRGEFYYLMMAEGGTAECHMVTISRSRQPYGPFENCPHNPLITHRSLMSPVQATGHADFVEDQNGRWWAVFLGFRYCEHGFHPLGRETYLAPMSWTDDGWPVINDHQPLNAGVNLATGLPDHPWPATPVRDEFSGPALRPQWVHLRNLPREAYSLSPDRGLSLECRPGSLDEPVACSAVLRRQQHFEFRFAASVDFAPSAEGEAAGLTVLMDHAHHYDIFLTRRDGQRYLVTRRRIGSLAADVASHPVGDGPLTLFIAGNRSHYRLGYHDAAGDHECAQGEVRYLCTETTGGYNGVMLGLFATAHGRTSANHARFAWADYLPRTS